MADFCATCAVKMGFLISDILAPAGKIVYEICEGCGPGWFDEHGNRVPDSPVADASPADQLAAEQDR